MKKLLLLLTLFTGIGTAFGSGVCTPDSAAFAAGVIVYPSALSVTRGVIFSVTTSILIPDSIDASAYDNQLPANTYYVYIDSIYVDSTTGAPAGISYAVTPGGHVWLHPGQYACIQFSGTSTAAAGSYPIAAYGGVHVHANILGFALDSFEAGQLPSPAFFKFNLNLSSPPVCTPNIAGFAAGAFASPATLPCIDQNSQYAGTISFRVPDSIDAHLLDSTYPAGFYYVHMDSIALDSIVGAPSGISLAVNPGSGVYLYPGQYGCVQVSGSTVAPVGNYSLGAVGHGCFHVQLTHYVQDSCIDGLLPYYFAYTLSVCGPSTVCTPDTAGFASGAYVNPTSLPCITPGSPYAGSVTIRVPDSIAISTFVAGFPGYEYVDSVIIDSVTGAPAGITITSNPGSNVWLKGGQYACAQFSGTTTVTAGNYPINVYVTGCLHGLLDTCAYHNLGSVFSFSLNICGGGCTVDTSQFSGGTHVYPPFLNCITTGDAFSGQVNIQAPDSLDVSDFISGITVPPGAGFVILDSMEISTVTGEPAGISASTSPQFGTWLHPGGTACAVFSGTVNAAVTSAGTYPLSITGIACGHANIVLHVAGTNIPIVFDTCVQNYSFSKVFPYNLNVCYPTGVAHVIDGVGLTIYPNPNQGLFTVTVSTSDHITGTMSVLDELGRVILSQNIDVTGTTQMALDMSGVSAGAYLLMINTGQYKSVKQFIVNK